MSGICAIILGERALPLFAPLCAFRRILAPCQYPPLFQLLMGENEFFSKKWLYFLEI